MKVKDWKEVLNTLPDEMNIVLSKAVILDEEKQEFTGVIDIPIIGTAVNEADNELRFVLGVEAAQHVFHPDEVKPFDPENPPAD